MSLWSYSRCGPAIVHVALLLLGFRACASDADQAHPLVGTWEVERVAVDRRDQPHWLYIPDDPRLFGRELRITTTQALVNDGTVPCQITQWTSSAGSLRQRIADSFPRSSAPGTASRPTLADFGLAAPQDSVSFHDIKCTQQRQPWDAAWFAVLPEDRLLLSYGAGVLLLLARQPSQAKPTPSFDCARAHNDAERAICSSLPMAAFDRSVAAAYMRASSLGDALALKSKQIEWLKMRNACGKKVECLTQTMRERVEELMQ